MLTPQFGVFLGILSTDPRAHLWPCFWYGINWNLAPVFLVQYEQGMQELPLCFVRTGLSLGMGWLGNVPRMGHRGWMNLSIAWDSSIFCGGKGHGLGWDA